MALNCDTCDFCDFFAGRLHLSHHKNDEAALGLLEDCRQRLIGHVSYIESMESRLSARRGALPDGFSYRQHLLSVPAGEEIWKINFLRFFYQQQILRVLTEGSTTARSNLLSILGDSGSHLHIAPDASLSISQSGTSIGFAFDSNLHASYKRMIGLPDFASTGQGIKVAIIDSGLDTTLGIAMSADSKNFSDDANVLDIHDNNGHGTIVASIIHDIVPDAQLTILKVGDSNPLSEWNVLAALLAANNKDVVNLSIAYGLPYRDCSSCGRRQTHSSRSAIFEQSVDELRRVRPENILVAAAGNRDQAPLDYPARFAEVVAVGSVDSSGNRSSFGPSSGSNYGTSAHGGSHHDLLFFAPGGGSSEFIGSTTTISGTTKQYRGTSFAAPYVSGLFAHYLGNPYNTRSRQAAINHFVNKAGLNPGIPGYNAADHGNGIIRLV